ncbi:hypothetical protein JL739_11285 [Listeria welshimeri]|uniref:DUF6678 family protein n=1 Tax=Listeria welshimeri TaxID=1643 RepID=UPI0010B90C01|nr:DUF6678 family protein [Listeria welshimeri]MBC1694433.1 hypothetical protein [Listeria welshimeri]MBC1864404.1 hypothetical protein [Listeria welshimeri]MBC1959948.1 hypothetical protein [Listeria welshimeri]MBC2352428.1 hypothetical protein [Listeria welshimeri]MBC2356690.1 hypothetical protein [Listeria welshimeri]
METRIDKYNEYKYYLAQHDDWITKLKLRVANITKEKKLYPIMNDSKWLSLQFAIDESLAFPPPYIDKYVTDEKEPDLTEIYQKIPTYHGDWSNYYEEGLPPLFNIEWLKVIPKYSQFQGHLIDGEIFDETIAFRELLLKENIPYEEERGVFTIYGYQSAH